MFLNRRTGRLHLDLSLKKGALADADPRRKDVAFHLGRGPDVDRLGRVQIALDLAVDDDDARPNIALHGSVSADCEALGMRDRALDAALDDKVFLRRQF